MKTKTTLLSILVMMFALCVCIAQTNSPLDLPGSGLGSTEGGTGLILVLIPLFVPILVRLIATGISKLPTWTFPILAAGLGAATDFVASLIMPSAGASPVFAALMGSAGVGLREIKDQVQQRITEGPKPNEPSVKSKSPSLVTSILLVGGLGGMLLSAPLVLTGCGSLKPVPVAEGHDAVVVNAERVQKSSLDIYEQTINWELAHRATLPASISRAVDKYRAEFLPAWKKSRVALQAYKDRTGPDASTVARVTAALSVAQSSLLSLMLSGASDAEVAQANSAINSLITSIGSLIITPTPP